MIDILSNFKKSENYFKTPYPHVIIDLPISEEVYNVLNEEYKSFENYFSKLNDLKNNKIAI